ncbi:MAG: hypothetical protein EKK52_14000 [Burkholderiales bacterium]|nr:MAG: hypothetical protein EKK52_14000 [Burkholderiales bacterium]
MTATQLSQTLLAPWRQRDLTAPWGRRAIAALLGLSLIGGLVLLQGPVRWAMPAGILLVVIHGTWIALGYNLQEQNHPIAARCVPGHLRALRAAALLAWAICTALAALMSWAMLPPMLTWQALLLGNAVIMVVTLWTLRAWWLWVVLPFAAPLLGALGAPLQPLWQAAVSLWQAHTDGLLALALLALAGLVTAVFGDGDTHHRRVYQRQRAMRAAQRAQLQGKVVSPAEALGGLDRVSRPFNTVLGAWRRHVLARADNRRLGSVMARAELVLHGNQHWTYQLLGLAWLAVFLLVVLGLAMVFTEISWREMLRMGSFGIAFGLGTSMVQPVLMRSQALWHSRREQALLRLLPHMPQGAAQNRAIAGIALRHAIGVWLVLAALALPLGWTSGESLMIWIAVVALPWLVWSATRPLARLRPPNAWTAAVPMFLWFMTAVLGQFLQQTLALPLPALALPVLGVTLAGGVWRWRRLARQPAALPVGRLR